MKNGRCRMHGGASLSGSEHPRWKHGRYAVTTFEGQMRRAGVEYRKRQRALRRESRYVSRKLQRWADAQIARRGWYSIDTGMRLYRQYRDEYRAKYGAPSTLSTFAILFYKPEPEPEPSRPGGSPLPISVSLVHV
jgi:hypothetical protein